VISKKKGTSLYFIYKVNSSQEVTQLVKTTSNEVEVTSSNPPPPSVQICPNIYKVNREMVHGLIH
jgi:hypothetical protein